MTIYRIKLLRLGKSCDKSFTVPPYRVSSIDSVASQSSASHYGSTHVVLHLIDDVCQIHLLMIMQRRIHLQYTYYLYPAYYFHPPQVNISKLPNISTCYVLCVTVGRVVIVSSCSLHEDVGGVLCVTVGRVVIVSSCSLHEDVGGVLCVTVGRVVIVSSCSLHEDVGGARILCSRCELISCTCTLR